MVDLATVDGGVNGEETAVLMVWGGCGRRSECLFWIEWRGETLDGSFNW